MRKHSNAEKEALSLALGRVCELQKQFGKTTAELETMVEGFCWILGDYPMSTILDAIRVYVKKNNDIPVPADIEKIINPPQERLSGAVYIQLKKNLRDDIYVTPEQREYCKAYERQEMDKVRGGSEELRDAQRELLQYYQQKQIEY